MGWGGLCKVQEMEQINRLQKLQHSWELYFLSIVFLVSSPVLSQFTLCSPLVFAPDGQDLMFLCQKLFEFIHFLCQFARHI